jgi:predicted KAP-like P-loop ATPase
MADPKPIDIINDNPERESVMFGFEAYAKTIAGVIANRKNDTPLVIGIYGSWGAGKTTLMEATRKLLKGKAYEDKKLFRQTKSVWFQAWKYGKEEEILAALIEEIFKTMKTHGFFEACKAEIEKLASELKPSKVIGSVTKLLTGQDITEFFGELEYKEKLGFYDTFQEFFDRLLWTYLRWRPKRSHAEQTDDQAHALVIFIDDLDRCPPGKIVRVL